MGRTRNWTDFLGIAAFIGVGAMVGAGIFSLLGSAGEIAGSAVWLSFVLAGIVAALQGYSFAKLGARFPSAGGLLEYINQAFGVAHISTIAAWLMLATNVINNVLQVPLDGYLEPYRRAQSEAAR